MNGTWEEVIYPSIVERGIYEDIIDECVEHVKNVSSVKSVLRYGGVGMPGISDIDLIYTVDPNSPPSPGALSYKSKIKEYSYCFVHGIGVLPDNMLGNLSYLGFYDNLDIIHGGAILAEKGSVASDQLTFSLMVDGLVDRLLALSKWLGARTCKARTVLVLLYSLKHTVTLCEELGVDVSDEILKYIKIVIEFRLNWFENPDEKMLRQLAEEGFNLFSSLTKSLGEFAITKSWWDGDVDKHRFKLKLGRDTTLEFKNLEEGKGEWDVSTNRIKILHKRIEVAQSTVAIDSLLAPHFLCYELVVKNDINKFNWSMDVRMGEEAIHHAYSDVLRSRIQSIISHTDFLKQHGFGTGCLHATGVLNPSLKHYGLRSNIISLIENGLRLAR